MYLINIDESSVSKESNKRRLLGDSGANHRVRWGSFHIRLPFPNKEYGNLPTPGDMWKVLLQIGVETKAGVEIGSDQEGVVIDSYEGIEYLRL